MGHHDHGFAALAAQFIQQRQNCLAGLIVESARGLVAQQDVGVFGQCTGDGAALLLAAGALGGEVVFIVLFFVI